MLGLLARRIDGSHVQLDRSLRSGPSNPPEHPARVAIQTKNHIFARYLGAAEVGQQASERIAMRAKRALAMLGNQSLERKRKQPLAHTRVEPLVDRRVAHDAGISDALSTVKAGSEKKPAPKLGVRAHRSARPSRFLSRLDRRADGLCHRIGTDLRAASADGSEQQSNTVTRSASPIS